MNRAFKPYHSLAVGGALILIASSFLPFRLFDFNLNGNFFVLSWAEFAKYVSAWLLTIFVAAYFVRSFLHSVVLSWIHLAAMTLVMITSLFFIFDLSKIYQSDQLALARSGDNTRGLVNLFYSFLALQLLLIANIVLGILRKRSGN